MRDLKELDRARERWRLVRRRLGQSADTEHGSLGLARRIENLSARLLILPGDPFATDLSFDEEFWGWWTNEGPSPFGTHVQWTNTEPTADAAVKYERGSENWTTYLGLHRHGGVEIGCDPSWLHDPRDRLFFRLHPHCRAGVDRCLRPKPKQSDRFGLVGPWELTLVFYQTDELAISPSFGVGWPESRIAVVHGAFGAQQEPHSHDSTGVGCVPGSLRDDVRDLAFDVGARIEDAWGGKYRRFLDKERGHGRGSSTQGNGACRGIAASSPARTNRNGPPTTIRSVTATRCKV